MKLSHTILATLAFLALTSCAGNSVSNVFDDFRHEPKAEYVHVPHILLRMGNSFAAAAMDGDDDGKALDITSKIKDVKVLDLDDCAPEVKARFLNTVNTLEDDGYECLVRVNDDGEKVRIFIRRDENSIREMLIINASDDDASLVQLQGNVKESDINSLLKMDFD